jgi:hypothetical protein
MKKGTAVRWITIIVAILVCSAQVGAADAEAKLDVTMHLVSAGGIGAEIGVSRWKRRPMARC